MDQLVRDAALRPFRNDMVADCTVAFVDREFKRKLDSNMSLPGCKNGVYDYNMGKLRPGRPSDYITKSTGRTFIDRNVDLQDIPLINRFFTDVLVQADVIDCVLCALCLSMRGVPLSKFWMWTGEGANGKSKLASLYRTIAGDYGFNLPVQVVTSKRIENGKPVPEINRARNTRIATISEPCPNEMLNAGAIKEMTGGDSMFTRGLYDDGAEMTCTFCPILLCNDMPNCNDQSEGMGRRQAVINFPVQFKEFPDPKKYPYEKKLDESIDKMIEEHADLFLIWCLTNGYEYAQKTGVQYPKSVQESTNIYKKDCDLIAQFKDEFIVKTFLTTDKLRWNTVLNAYTRYYKSNHTGRLPRVVDLRRSFEKALQVGEKLHNYEWAGWMMPTPCTTGF